MAGSSLYKDDEDSPITDINVTPFVDILLVLLVVFIVTAKLIVTRGVDVDKPKESHGGEEKAGLIVTVKVNGDLYVNGTQFTTDATAVAKIKAVAATMQTPKAVISGDRKAAYGGVAHAINLCLDANVTAIALENVEP
jgi:biopolymer transport protein ExbD